MDGLCNSSIYICHHFADISDIRVREPRDGIRHLTPARLNVLADWEIGLGKRRVTIMINLNPIRSHLATQHILYNAELRRYKVADPKC